MALPELQSMGYQLIIIPSDLQRAAIYAMQQTLNAIKNTGDSDTLQNQMVKSKIAKFNERARYLENDAKFSKG